MFFPKSDGTQSDTVEEDTTSNSVNTDPALESFRDQITARHNLYRSQHQVGNLVRDADLHRIAQNAADDMAEAQSFIFTSEKYNGKSIGQNLFKSWGTPTGNSIADMWYNKINNYNWNSPSSSSFTQLVWKNTQKIGCGYVCSGSYCYGACVYYPPGNYNNQYTSNVFPKTS